MRQQRLQVCLAFESGVRQPEAFKRAVAHNLRERDQTKPHQNALETLKTVKLVDLRLSTCVASPQSGVELFPAETFCNGSINELPSHGNRAVAAYQETYGAGQPYRNH